MSDQEHRELTNVLRKIQHFTTVEYYRNNSQEVIAQLKIMNAMLSKLALDFDLSGSIIDDTTLCEYSDCPYRKQLRTMSRKVKIMQDREYFAYSHFVSGNLYRIIGLIQIIIMEIDGHRYARIGDLLEKLKKENERLHSQIKKILETGNEG